MFSLFRKIFSSVSAHSADESTASPATESASREITPRRQEWLKTETPMRHGTSYDPRPVAYRNTLGNESHSRKHFKGMQNGVSVEEIRASSELEFVDDITAHIVCDKQPVPVLYLNMHNDPFAHRMGDEAEYKALSKAIPAKIHQFEPEAEVTVRQIENTFTHNEGQNAGVLVKRQGHDISLGIYTANGPKKRF